MRGQITHPNVISQPVWMGDFASRDHLEPWPARADPTQFVDALGIVVIPSALAGYGATTISIDALVPLYPVQAGILEKLIPSGTLLEFTPAWAPVVVTLTAAGKAADATISVAALPGPLPAGAVLQFLPGAGDAEIAQVAVAAAAGAVSIAVTPLDGVLTNHGACTWPGGRKLAVTTVDAIYADTTLTVSPLELPVADDDVAVWSRYGRRTIKSGTLVGRTYAERASGDPFGPWVTGDDEIFLTAFDVEDAFIYDMIELYRHQSIVKENFLPDYATISADPTTLAALRAAYQCILGAV